jgi:hypothetical protein
MHGETPSSVMGKTLSQSNTLITDTRCCCNTPGWGLREANAVNNRVYMFDSVTPSRPTHYWKRSWTKRSQLRWMGRRGYDITGLTCHPNRTVRPQMIFFFFEARSQSKLTLNRIRSWQHVTAGDGVQKNHCPKHTAQLRVLNTTCLQHLITTRLWVIRPLRVVRVAHSAVQ